MVTHLITQPLDAHKFGTWCCHPRTFNTVHSLIFINTLLFRMTVVCSKSVQNAVRNGRVVHYNRWAKTLQARQTRSIKFAITPSISMQRHFQSNDIILARHFRRVREGVVCLGHVTWPQLRVVAAEYRNVEAAVGMWGIWRSFTVIFAYLFGTS